MAKKLKQVDTSEVKTTVQVLDEEEQEMGAEGKTVTTTTAVFTDVEEVEGDDERDAHQAVFAEGDPPSAAYLENEKLKAEVG